MITYRDQLAELNRERKMRERVYARFIADGKLTADEAHRRNDRLDAAITTLEFLVREHEPQLPL